MSGDGEDLAVGVFHLVSAHELVLRRRLTPTYVALCGELVKTREREDTDCPNGCECEDLGRMAHCLACLREALRHNQAAGVEADDGSMAATRG